MQFILIIHWPLAIRIGWIGVYRDNNVSGYAKLSLGISFGIGGRMLSHVVSGAIFFKEFAGGQNPDHSLGYNASYLVPELIISLLVMVLIWKPLKKSIKIETRMKGLIISSGSIKDYKLLEDLDESDYIVCADGGLDHIIRIDKIPNVRLGIWIL